MFSRKGQFTIFVVLGIVIIFIVAFILLIKTSHTGVTLDKQADEILAEFQKKGVDQYVSSCLKTVGTRGIKIMGLQGGAIYTSQGGTIPDEGDDSVILEDELGEANFYPYKQGTTEITTLYGIKRLPSRELGIVTLNKACDKDGPNAENIDIAATDHTCEGDLYNDITLTAPSTVQNQLTAYIDNNIPDCANITIYTEKVGHEIVQDGDPASQVIFGPADVTLSIIYPLEIRIHGKQPVKRSARFSARLPVRLLQTYTFAYFLLMKDTDMFGEGTEFTIIDDYWNVSYYDPNIHVQYFDNEYATLCNNCPPLKQFDNVLIIEDRKSVMGNDFFKLVIPIQNRPPFVVDWDEVDAANISVLIKNSVIDGDFIKLSDAASNYVTLTLKENITFYDPDDNSIDVDVQGWQRSYWTRYSKREEASGADPYNCDINYLIWDYKFIEECGEVDISENFNTTFISDNPWGNWEPNTEGNEFSYNPSTSPYDDDTWAENYGAHNITLVLLDESYQSYLDGAYPIALDTRQELKFFIEPPP